MKYKVEESEQIFAPVTITITCNTQYELDKVHQAIGGLPKELGENLFKVLNRYTSADQKSFYRTGHEVPNVSGDFSFDEDPPVDNYPKY